MILIGNIVEGIREKLEAYFSGSGDPNPEPDPENPPIPFPDEVVLGNVALLDAFNASEQNIRNKLIISLVSIEEEKALRYAKTQTILPTPNPDESQIIQHHPVIYLNLYLLFSAHNSSYKVSLNQLSAVVNFFQRKHIYKGSDFEEENLQGLDRIVFELVTISFEQLNHIWGVLGGKYIPSAFYKVRILPHEDIDTSNGTGRILRERSNSSAGT